MRRRAAPATRSRRARGRRRRGHCRRRRPRERGRGPAMLVGTVGRARAGRRSRTRSTRGPGHERRLRPVRAVRPGYQPRGARTDRRRRVRARRREPGSWPRYGRRRPGRPGSSPGRRRRGRARGRGARRRRRSPDRYAIVVAAARARCPLPAERSDAMRSPLAYAPRPGPLRGGRRRSPRASTSAPRRCSPSSSPTRSCSPATGAAAIVAGRLAGACAGACGRPLRWGATLGVLIVVVNVIASQRGDTILLRGGELPVLGQVDVSAEALVEGAILALRITVVVCAFAVYSPASIPTGSCACCGRSPATRR